MQKFVISGGKKLTGQVRISGAKNAATPIIAATILAKGDFILNNIPNILDVRRMMGILRKLGAKVKYDPKIHQAIINTEGIKNGQADFRSVKRLRSSILLMGPLLARFKSVKMMHPGGCNIGNRPVGAHFDALRKLGAEIKSDKDYYSLKRKGLKAGKIVLPEFSVTATENALMLASLTEGRTTIELAATEPHVVDLGNFLIKMGANIVGLGTHTIVIEGVEELQATKHNIIPDQIETGTWLALGAVLGNPLVIRGADKSQLDLILLVLSKAGVQVKLEKADNGLVDIIVKAPKKIKAFNIQTLPYPGFPTDLQSVFAVIATQAQGNSLIHDSMYEGRLKYINELQKMGASATVCDPHRAIITGPIALRGAQIDSFDLRAGAAVIIAALVAKGKTTISEIEQVDRGYEDIDKKLKGIGASITRITT